MRVVVEHRAAHVLQNLSRAAGDAKPFLVPSNICEVVPKSLAAVGRPVHFVDIDPRDLVMDRERCLSLLSDHPAQFAGVVFVRTYGAETHEEPFFARVKSVAPQALLIDDKCLCRPACSGEQLCPSADATVFSTGYAKHVDLSGGGFAHLAPAVAYVEDSSTPTPIWPAYRDRILSALVESDRHKRALNAIYVAGLPRRIQLPELFQHWRFNIMVDKSAQLVESLFAAGLFASRHYCPASGASHRAPVAEQLHRRIVNLFNDRYYTEAQARQTVDVVRRLHQIGGPTPSDIPGWRR